MAPFTPDSPLTVWRKSSFCQNGECAEVATQGEEILLRSTRSPGELIRLSTAEWQAFVRGIRADEFGDLG